MPFLSHYIPCFKKVCVNGCSDGQKHKWLQGLDRLMEDTCCDITKGNLWVPILGGSLVLYALCWSSRVKQDAGLGGPLVWCCFAPLTLYCCWGLIPLWAANSKGKQNIPFYYMHKYDAKWGGQNFWPLVNCAGNELISRAGGGGGINKDVFYSRSCIKPGKERFWLCVSLCSDTGGIILSRVWKKENKSHAGKPQHLNILVSISVLQDVQKTRVFSRVE